MTAPETVFVVGADGTTTDCPPTVDAGTSTVGAGQVVPVDKALSALQVATLKVLFDRWALLDRDVRDGLHAATVPGERLPAVLPGTSEPVAWVTRTKPAKPKPTPTVTDPQALLAWVREHRPDEIVTPPPPPPQVRSSYLAALLKQLSADGGVVDEETGELTVPPGLEWVTKPPASSHLQVRLEDGGAAAIEAAWGDGSLVLALPGGDL